MMIIISPCKLAEPRVGNLLKHSPHHLVPAAIVTIIIVTIIIIIIVTITTNVITSMIIIISINTPFNMCSEKKCSITNCQKSLKHWFCQGAPFTPSASYSQSLHQHDLNKQREHQNQNDHHERFDLTPPTLRATLLFICRDWFGWFWAFGWILRIWGENQKWQMPWCLCPDLLTFPTLIMRNLSGIGSEASSPRENLDKVKWKRNAAPCVHKSFTIWQTGHFV